MSDDPITFQGQPCLHGHAGLRYVKTGHCVQCRIRQVQESKRRRELGLPRPPYQRPRKYPPEVAAERVKTAKQKHITQHQRAGYKLAAEQLATGELTPTQAKTKYRGTPCRKCNHRLRYITNGTCVWCARTLAYKKYQMRKEKRERDAKQENPNDEVAV